MSQPDDVTSIRRHVMWLAIIIAVAVIGLVALTFYLYGRFTAATPGTIN